MHLNDLIKQVQLIFLWSRDGFISETLFSKVADAMETISRSPAHPAFAVSGRHYASAAGVTECDFDSHQQGDLRVKSRSKLRIDKNFYLEISRGPACQGFTAGRPAPGWLI